MWIGQGVDVLSICSPSWRAWFATRRLMCITQKRSARIVTLVSGTGIVSRGAVAWLCALFAVTTAQAQVLLPISPLEFDAPVLPPQFMVAAPWSMREPALLPPHTLEEKDRAHGGREYRLEVGAAYQDVSGTFGSLNLGNGQTGAIDFAGDVKTVQAHLSVTGDDAVFFGAMGLYEEMDFKSFVQNRAGVAPYGKWVVPVNSRVGFNLVGMIYYCDNSVDSRLSSRQFTGYSSRGAGVSAALHFDAREVFRSVTLEQGGVGNIQPVGSLAFSYQHQSDDAERQVVYQQRVVDEAGAQRVLRLSGNIGTRLRERSIVMIAAEYVSDQSDYGGALQSAADHYTTLGATVARLFARSWRLTGGATRVFGHDVDVSTWHLNIENTF